MPPRIKRVLFGLFVASGFCGLLYQIVWMRLALSSFGVITPFVSVVVSVFMLGLAIGTWLGGRYAERHPGRALLAYAVAEVGIAVGGLVMPSLFDVGRQLLLPVGAVGSSNYLLLSSLVILVAMLPWCVFMGATLPLVMAFVRQLDSGETRTFSFLYLANVIGALLGTALTSIALIETFGFAGSLRVAAGVNLLLATVAAVLASRTAATRAANAANTAAPDATAGATPATTASDALGTRIGTGDGRFLCLVLFLSGFASMGMEMAWLRALTPIMGTVVYAFAGLIGTYLLGTWLGSFLYRRRAVRATDSSMAGLLALATLTGLLPALVVDPDLLPDIAAKLGLHPLLELVVPSLISLAPICVVLGYLTPQLVDRYSAGRPASAGRAYALNIVGSILGPLVAAYLLLPTVGARLAIVLLAAPLGLAFVWSALRSPGWRPVATVATAVLLLAAFGHTAFRSRSYEEGSMIDGAVLRRDHTATVISHGKGFQRGLLVNGRGMTILNTVTKMMAHMPLASLEKPPENSLVICFGMGTTFRSLLSWDIDATAVELVPSVVDAYGYYFDDAEEVMARPNAHVVIDDGRRYLARSGKKFDLITIDPPPPVETAGSSLLYSADFLKLAKEHLAPGGIVQVWFPEAIRAESAIGQAVLQTCAQEFPHLRIFLSMTGRGLHILCSMTPLPDPDAARLVARMPEAAQHDLLEWQPDVDNLQDFVQEKWVDRELPLDALLDPDRPDIITDDRPFNEYFVLRLFDRLQDTSD